MSKTAIQELLDIVEMDFNNGAEISMKVFYGMLTNALIKEREQIEEAYGDGLNAHRYDFCDRVEYYNKKFGNKTEHNEKDSSNI